MKYYHTLLTIFLLSVLFTTSCIPPRCKIPKCAIVIDHLHAKHGKGGAPPKKPAKHIVLYRGLPWYRYIFYKRHKPDPNKQEVPIKGRYRKIDTRDAYHKK